MSVTVTIPAPGTWLTTLDAVHRELGLTTADEDLVLAGMIDRASSAIARECGRVWGIETVYETLKGTNSQILGLSRAPIIAVTEVLEDSLPITDYSIEDAEAGALYREQGWRAQYGASGYGGWDTAAYASGYILPGGQAAQRYIVTYRAGYGLPNDASSTLPGAVEQACLETVKTWFAQSDGVVADASAVRVGSLQVQYPGATVSDAAARLGLPSVVLGLLRQYRRVMA